MAVYNIDILDPLQGKDIGIVLGEPKTNQTLTGTVDGSNVSYTIDSSMLPVFDRECDGPPVDKDDITAYVTPSGGTKAEATISEYVPSTGVVTLASAPPSGATVDFNFIEEKEPYIAHTLKVDAKYDEKTIGRLRSANKKKIYGAREVTISVDLYMVDMEFLGMFFDPTTGAMLSEPPDIYGYIPLERSGVEVGRLYFTNCKMIPKSLLDVKEGDIAGYSLEISVSEDPVMWEATA